ncbi:MAG: phosphatidylglycerophosphatase A [Magnetococcales bacterium]|nr:phosphatidylglycerophosphatase A [Magnetococcales bacterium]HIJ83070.1 phosphatidylglycerophosphatase A [Magnetococcales bacterium]
MNQRFLDTCALHVATLGGVGRVGAAPGTMGSLVTLPLCYWAVQAGPVWHLPILAAIITVGTWAAHNAARQLGNKDPREVVVDEMAGMMLTMVMAPPGWGWLMIGFLAFRLFDIWKPWPVNWIDRTLPGGWGIMADDLAAGAYAWLAVALSSVWME